MANLPKAMKPIGLLLTRTTRRQQQVESDARRGSAAARGYDARWAEEARAHRRDHPLCVCCIANGRVSASTLVDHIVPHKGDEALFWDRSNRQALCDWCHNKIKALIEARYAAGRCTISDLSLNRPLPEFFG